LAASGHALANAFGRGVALTDDAVQSVLIALVDASDHAADEDIDLFRSKMPVQVKRDMPGPHSDLDVRFPGNPGFDRLQQTLVGHLRKMGYQRVSDPVRKNIVELLLDTQDRKPFFWIESTLPFCWNNPKYWNKTSIAYQWGHLNPLNEGKNLTQLIFA
jgi:hypothetical protein